MLRLRCLSRLSPPLATAQLASILPRPRCHTLLQAPCIIPCFVTSAIRLYCQTSSRRLDPNTLMKHSESELFNYTTGRFLANEAYHLSVRKRIFDVPGLFRIIAKAINCRTEQIVDFQKLDEGGFNRVFLVTLDTGLQLVARIPYPLLTPKSYTVASEVATMDFLRSKGLPIPKVYAYSFDPSNEAKTEYILMEYVKGSSLNDVWSGLKDADIASLMDGLATLESTMMSISFPVGGSIYDAKDLIELSGKEGILLKEEAKGEAAEGRRFSIGPDLSIRMWYGRREQLDVFRGPYEDAESALTAGAQKELEYLHRFGAPRMPYDHFRPEYYKYHKQPPQDHIKNLTHYLRLAPSLVPDDSSLSAFCIRHPDLSESNIRVSTDSNDSPKIVGILDWQHAVVLPLFLFAGMPKFLEDGDDEVSRTMIKPTLPSDFDELSEYDQDREQWLLPRRLAYYHYNLSTVVYNKTHHRGLSYSLNPFCRRIANEASAPWEGETIKLLCALIDLVLSWDDIVTNGTPCPVAFTEEEVDAAAKLLQDLAQSTGEVMMKEYVGYAEDTWVPADHYEVAKARGEELKRKTLEACAADAETTEADYADIEANWPLNDVSEEKLLEYK